MYTRSSAKKISMLATVCLALLTFVIAASRAQPPVLPTGASPVALPTPRVTLVLPEPEISPNGSEVYTAAGKKWRRYKIKVDNWSAYWPALFAPSPKLPPCGKNTAAARMWVSVIDDKGNVLQTFCGFKTSHNLTSIWFAVPEGQDPPGIVKVLLNDRLTKQKVVSHLLETAVGF